MTRAALLQGVCVLSWALAATQAELVGFSIEAPVQQAGDYGCLSASFSSTATMEAESADVT